MMSRVFHSTRQLLVHQADCDIIAIIIILQDI